jgi:hypothetical protein
MKHVLMMICIQTRFGLAKASGLWDAIPHGVSREEAKTAAKCKPK